MKTATVEYVGVTRLEDTFTLDDSVQSNLPVTLQLMVEGGDDRILLDPNHGLNKYGCRVFPDADLATFSSSTASVISRPALIAADRLRNRLVHFAAKEAHAVVYSRELNRVRRELVQLCGVADLVGLEVVFAASGTDIHLISSQLVGRGDVKPPLAIMIDPVETGSCVPSALSGCHFSTRTAMGDLAVEGAIIPGANTLDVASVAVRLEDGTPRSAAAIDAEVESLVAATVAKGQRIFLILVDVSKTGIIAPSPACVIELQNRFPNQIDVLVDACQFRIAPSTLRAYLEKGFMVALTGSKFMTGPTFSGALFIPESVAMRYRRHRLPKALRLYSARGDWPINWVTAATLNNTANFGLLLRWEAALQEMRAFRAVPEVKITHFLQDFKKVVQERLLHDPVFSPLVAPRLDRTALTDAAGWDQIQTIFPFMLFHHVQGEKVALTQEETAMIYRLLQVDLNKIPGFDGVKFGGGIASLRCQLGQPVVCGRHQGNTVSALRLCASSRLIVEAYTGKNFVVMARILSVLDKVALLVKNLPDISRSSQGNV